MEEQAEGRRGRSEARDRRQPRAEEEEWKDDWSGDRWVGDSFAHTFGTFIAKRDENGPRTWYTAMHLLQDLNRIWTNSKLCS